MPLGGLKVFSEPHGSVINMLSLLTLFLRDLPKTAKDGHVSIQLPSYELNEMKFCGYCVLSARWYMLFTLNQPITELWPIVTFLKEGILNISGQLLLHIYLIKLKLLKITCQ